MATAIIVLVIVILCIIGIKGMAKRAASGCCGSGGDTVEKVKVQDKDLSHYPYSYTVEVNGMTCKNCKKRVENAFNTQEGIYAIVNLEKKNVVIHSKEKMDVSDIMSTIWQSGYEPGECEENR